MVSCAFSHIPTPHSTICLCSSPSTGGSTRATPLYSTFTCTISSTITSPLHPPISFSPPSPVAAAPSSHASSPAPSTFASRMTSPVVDPLHLFDHDSEPEHEFDPFPLHWQILIWTMNLLWICDLLHLPYLFMVNPQGDGQGDQQGGAQGGKVKAMHWHHPACPLHIIVPAFHTMMDGPHIDCQHMGILFAPSVM